MLIIFLTYFDFSYIYCEHLVRWKCTVTYYEYFKYASGENVLVLSGRSCPSEHTARCIKKIFLLQLDINIYYLFDLMFYTILFYSILFIF